MRITGLFMFLTWFMVGCNASQAEHENLIRRVAALERRVRVLEGRGDTPKARARSKVHKAKASPGGSKGVVMVEGDALRVFLRNDRRRIPIPGLAPANTYSIRAIFTLGEQPVVAGQVEIKAKHETVITCDKATQKCTAAAPKVIAP